MIKANELRLGNHLQPVERQKAAYGCHPAIVTSIQEDKIIICNHYPGHWFEPIPLTEEWLVKFGFIKDTYNDTQGTPCKLDFYQKGFFKVFIMHEYNPPYNEVFVPAYFIHVIETINLKYVNQLQNFYFALTGEELIIK